MKYAVIRTGGKQYKVEANDVIKVERLQDEALSAGETVVFSDVLAVGGEGSLATGKDAEAFNVSAEVIDERKDDKVLIFKKKRRHNYRRFKGHRQTLVWVRIKAIGTDIVAPAKVEKTEPKKVASGAKQAKKSEE